ILRRLRRSGRASSWWPARGVCLSWVLRGVFQLEDCGTRRGRWAQKGHGAGRNPRREGGLRSPFDPPLEAVASPNLVKYFKSGAYPVRTDHAVLLGKDKKTLQREKSVVLQQEIQLLTLHVEQLHQLYQEAVCDSSQTEEKLLEQKKSLQFSEGKSAVDNFFQGRWDLEKKKGRLH
ncbi:uncharacterized protein LOC110203827, partial [Phascolarctos cinereus]